MLYKKTLFSLVAPLFLFLLIGFLPPSTAEAREDQDLQIKNVYTDKSIFNPAQGEKTKLHFSLSTSSRVTVTIYDSLNRAVTTLLQNKPLAAGNHQISWDGLNRDGKNLPRNYYLYTLEAEDSKGKVTRYDPSDLTGGKQIGIKDIKYNRDTNQVSFILKENAILNLRVGMVDGGPMMNTLIDWMPYSAGSHSINWDGRDRSGEISLKNVKKLDINGPAYSLPMNAIILTGDQPLKRPLFLDTDDVQDSLRPMTSDPKRRMMFNHWQHPRNQCYDPDILLQLPAAQQYDEDGLPLISDPLKLTLGVREPDRDFMMNQRFEIVCYVDFLYMHEEEMGYLPYYWAWDPHGVNDGVHYITVMFRGYEGHFGTTTIKVMVRKQNNKQ